MYFLLSEITCITSSNQGTEETTASVAVASGDLNFEGSVTYSFASASTPMATTVAPTEVSNGDVITISGSNLDGATQVLIGNSDCSISATSSTTITCTVGFNRRFFKHFTFRLFRGGRG